MEDKAKFISHVQLVLLKNDIPPWIVYGGRVMENLLTFGFRDDGGYGISHRRLFLRLCLLAAKKLKSKDQNLENWKGRYPVKGVFSSFRISDKDIVRYWGISGIVITVDPEIPAIIEVRERNIRGTLVGIQLGNFKRYLERVKCEEEYLTARAPLFSGYLSEA